MSFSSRNKRPQFREIFLSDENRRLRIILLCVFLAIGITALTVGLIDALNVDPGWQEVEVSSDDVHCGGDFTFHYYFGGAGTGATAIHKDLIATYSACAQDAYRMFTPDQSWEGNVNIYTINRSVDQILTVHPVLYDAFNQMELAGNRSHYLGPVYRVYQNLFFAEDDAQAAIWDPNRSQDMKEYVAKVAEFARDPQAIQLELLGENQVRLRLSQVYQDFAKEEGIEDFLDFSWMKNAFIIDYFADSVQAKGYTQGYFVSRDGFTRNLTSNVQFSLNLFDRQDAELIPMAVMSYEGPMSIAVLRDYPMTDWDFTRYYSYDDGTSVTGFADAKDGISRCAVSDLTAYGKDVGCAELLMQMAPIFVTETFNPDGLKTAENRGIHSIWAEGFVLYHTDENLTLSSLMDKDGYAYKTQQIS